jgi:hypothetical protein
MLNDAETITLYISENGDDQNEGNRERPLMSAGKAVQMIRGKGFKKAELVVSGTIQEPVAPKAMIEFVGDGLPEIILRGESAERPGILSAEGLDRRVMYIGDDNMIRILDHLTVSGGTTNNEGGSGICVNHATLILEGGSITKNDSRAGMGGGVYVGKDAEFIMYGGSITRNHTLMSGGGVFVDDGGVFKLEGGRVFKNRVLFSGGGVFVGLDSTFEMNGGVVGDNTVGDEQATTFLDVAMKRGEGGGVYVCESGKFIMNAGEIRDNHVRGTGPEKNAIGEGGGVYVDKKAVFVFHNGSIFQNSALSWGGGVYTKGSFTMYAGEIRGNSARIGGGGINVSSDGVCAIKGGVLTGNFAGRGGGAIYTMENSVFDFTDGLVIQNRASESGRAFMLDGKATISGGCIKGLTQAEMDKLNRKVKTRSLADLPMENYAIYLRENGHLTFSGGEIYGPIGQTIKDQFVDTRNRTSKHSAV